MFEQGAFTDIVFRAEAERAGLEGRDRAFAMRLAYGTVQRRMTLDYLVEGLTSRKIDDLDDPVVAGLRIGLYQVLFMDRVPAHAAVDESVALTRAARSRGHGLVNATLRRATREGAEMVEQLGDATVDQAALRHSHPRWIAEMWWHALGEREAVDLMIADNESPENAMRVNTLAADANQVVELLRSEGIESRRDEHVPEAIVLDQPYDVHGSELFERGLVMPQSRASMLVAHALDPQAGERVLDLCAAPGGKTGHIAALMADEGELIAVEHNRERATRLTANLERLGIKSASVVVGDAREPAFGADFDRVLVDPPCSDLGTLQSRPDARWRKSAEQVSALVETQRKILTAGASALKPGGTMVYSTCTISPEENQRQIEAFLAGHRFELLATSAAATGVGAADSRRLLQTLPNRDRTDGFFIAAMRRSA